MTSGGFEILNGPHRWFCDIKNWSGKGVYKYKKLFELEAYHENIQLFGY